MEFSIGQERPVRNRASRQFFVDNAKQLVVVEAPQQYVFHRQAGEELIRAVRFRAHGASGKLAAAGVANHEFGGV